ncbi:hypothetical protein GCM10010448_13250 [Streptomyces glomeratus]|uniref:Uncharacterized protein n=1 Tax=Streptomyces glomeratus TaxID=284452 RepID=A0ABP6L6W8_9ACTN
MTLPAVRVMRFPSSSSGCGSRCRALAILIAGGPATRRPAGGGVAALQRLSVRTIPSDHGARAADAAARVPRGGGTLRGERVPLCDFPLGHHRETAGCGILAITFVHFPGRYGTGRLRRGARGPCVRAGAVVCGTAQHRYRVE